MKLKSAYFNQRSLKLFALASLLVGASVSCTKEKEESIAIDGNYNLIVSVNGIEEYVSAGDLTKQASSKAEKAFDIEYYNGFDAITNFEESLPLAEATNLNSSSINIKNIAAKSTLGNNVKYRLLIFRDDNNTLVENKELSAVNKEGLKLNSGIRYRWVAFSTNETTVPNITGDNIISKDALENKDFLYSSDTITLKVGQNSLPITFKRYTTQYEVNIDVRGMFGELLEGTEVTLSSKSYGNLFTKSDFNVLTGNYTGTPVIVKLKGSKITGSEVDKKKVTFFSASDAAVGENELVVKFSPLKLRMHDNSIREFENSEINLKHKSLKGTNGDISSTRGRKYTITATLVESGLRVGNSSTVWARSNLWYDASNPTAPYRFRVSPFYRDEYSKENKVLTDPNDLWKWRALTPDGTPNQGDPCSLVYPAGVWRMPTASEYQTLISQNPISAGQSSNSGILNALERNDVDWTNGFLEIGAYKYLEFNLQYNASNPNQPNAYKIPYINGLSFSTSDKLSFGGIGYKNKNNKVKRRPAYGVGINLLGIKVVDVVDGGGFYWTSTKSGNNPSSFQYDYTSVVLVGVNLSRLLGINLLDISLLSDKNFAQVVKSDLAQDHRLNIRCVRAQ